MGRERVTGNRETARDVGRYVSSGVTYDKRLASVAEQRREPAGDGIVAPHPQASSRGRDPPERQGAG